MEEESPQETRQRLTISNGATCGDSSSVGMTNIVFKNKKL